jgi:acetoin utilization deacetylase AcuC-like enzyme
VTLHALMNQVSLTIIPDRTAMLPFKLVYSEDYYLPIGAHVFPAEKYQRIHKRLMETGVAEASDFFTPQPASDQDILLVHTPQYVQKLKTGTPSPREELEMEIPFSPELVRAFWLAAGGSILAAEYALRDRVAFKSAADSITPFLTMARVSA